MKGKQKRKLSGIIIPALRGALGGLAVTVVIVLIFAAVVKQTGFDSAVISAVNQVIKLLSALLAGFLAARSTHSAVAGGLAGFIYVAVGFLIFSLVEGHFGSFAMFGADAISGIAMGAVAAYLTGRLRGIKSSAKEKR